ncbi:uncharacterized protein N7487_007336 [Penicillium crustosum]|uniref:uncharacterized protein n=1 Tax=Penicillium crustosum TaxID=36656 RepID=UPI002388ED9C|nr:uncharacterized protein N7487_007336 [Penicillium crustosum]KAJ5401440.1 hypothetical protein N7487_007336 [Penicillium crustosum]
MTKERTSDTADQAKATMRGVAPHRLHSCGGGVVPLNALFFSTRVSNLVLQLLCNLIWTCSVKFGLLCFLPLPLLLLPLFISPIYPFILSFSVSSQYFFLDCVNY